MNRLTDPAPAPGFKDAVLAYIKRVKDRHERVEGNEQATKQSLIVPLFMLVLGYDLTDPNECEPEYRADFGKDRSVKPVDWAFYQDGKPIFLVEAKEAGRKLGGYDEQLGDYFAKVPEVRLGILTNGVTWRFFTDLVHQHLMDKEPFVEWNVLKDAEPPYALLTLLQKINFQTELICTFAKRKHQHNLLVNELAKVLEPSSEFIKLAVKEIETRVLHPHVVEEWRPILASAIGEWAKQRALTTVLTQSPTQADLPSQLGIPRPGPTRGGGTLADLIAAGILTPPLKLFCKYKDKSVEADLRPDGQVVFQGTVYPSPSEAGAAARATVTGHRMNTNGWTFWKYEDQNGKRRRLDDARMRLPKGKGGGRRDRPERNAIRKRFWAALLDRPKIKNTRHEGIAPSEYHWIGARCGVRSLQFNYVIGQDEGRAELYIDGDSKEENKNIFKRLRSHKDEIERTLGAQLSWEPLEVKRACRIAYAVPGGGWKSDESKWPSIQDAMIDAMARLEKALAPQLAALKT